MSAPLRNWAGNIDYGARRIHSPADRTELMEVVANARAARALGSRHSFNDIADTDTELISTRHLDKVVGIDEAARTVTVEGGITYGQLCIALAKEGLALPNLASLPHISVAGAVSTSTHGSGDRNGTLATSVRILPDLIGRLDFERDRGNNPQRSKCDPSRQAPVRNCSRNISCPDATPPTRFLR
jgi:alditol oxidase